MSQNNFTLKLLGIEDQNIKIIDAQDNVDKKTNEHFKLISASLTYPIKRCVNCGFLTIVKNGFRKTHIRLDSLNDVRYELVLAKQRYRCRNCYTTFGVKTDLTKTNQTLSCKLKNQIFDEWYRHPSTPVLIQCQVLTLTKNVYTKSTSKKLFF